MRRRSRAGAAAGPPVAAGSDQAMAGSAELSVAELTVVDELMSGWPRWRSRASSGSIGRGPRWRSLFGGRSVVCRIDGRRVDVRLSIVARPGHPLVPLTRQVREAVAAAIERLVDLEAGDGDRDRRRRRRLTRRRRAGAAPSEAGGRSDVARTGRAARRLALASVFEAEFGQRTAAAVLERHLAEIEADPDRRRLARLLVAAVVDNRADIDALIERTAPQYPVVQLARMDRALLRCAHRRGATLRDDAGPGGDRRVGRAGTHLQW